MPESDVSDADSYLSGEDVNEEGSPTSSPLGTSDASETKDEEGSHEQCLDDAQTVTQLHEVSSSQPSSSAFRTAPIDQEHSDANSWMDDPSDSEVESEAEDYEAEEPIPKSLPVKQPEQDAPEQSSKAAPEDHPFVNGSFMGMKARTPSPSDAAMAKPSVEPVFAPPFVQHLQQAAVTNGDPSESRSNTAWAGHNSVLYDPMPRVHGVPGFSAQPLMPGLPEMYVSEGNFTPITQYSLMPLEPRTVPLAPSVTSKISISNIVDQVAIEKPSEVKPLYSKRKADQISSDAPLEEFAAPSSDFGSIDLGDIHATTTSEEASGSTNKTITSSLSVTHDSATGQTIVNGVPLETELPPRKKIKYNKHKAAERPVSNGSGFAKVAAATIAGMAIGTVGTILGLAALPADYFV